MLNNSTCEYNILHVIYIILFPFCLSKCETIIIAVVIRHNLTSNFVENVKSATSYLFDQRETFGGNLSIFDTIQRLRGPSGCFTIVRLW